MRVLVISGRSEHSDLADACSFDFEDVIVTALSADLFTSDVDTNSLSPQYDLAIVVGISYKKIRDLLRRLLPQVRKRIEGPVIGYLFGAYGSLLTHNWRQTVRRIVMPRAARFAALDRLYLGIGNDADSIADHLNMPTHYLPMAANVLSVGAEPYHSRQDRPISLNAFGRQKRDVLYSVCDQLNRPGSDGLVYYTNFLTADSVIDMVRYRAMFWQLLRRSRLSAAYDHFATDSANAKLSYVGPRWFEALAAGTVLVGRAPDTEDRARLLDWVDATIDLSLDPKMATDELMALLDDEERIREASRRNLVEMSRRHDWGHRIAEILSIEGFEPPASLTEHLSNLEAHANSLLNGSHLHRAS